MCSLLKNALQWVKNSEGNHSKSLKPWEQGGKKSQYDSTQRGRREIVWDNTEVRYGKPHRAGGF